MLCVLPRRLPQAVAIRQFAEGVFNAWGIGHRECKNGVVGAMHRPRGPGTSCHTVSCVAHTASLHAKGKKTGARS